MHDISVNIVGSVGSNTLQCICYAFILLIGTVKSALATTSIKR